MMEKLRPVHITLLLAILLISSSFHRPPVDLGDGKIKRLVIDAGHGGHDPGALGSKAKEKEVTLAIAKKLKETLNKHTPDVEVVLTRDNDKFIELHNRAKYVSDNKADFFISIHCNSSRNKNAQGSETYVLGTHKAEDNMEVVMRENSVILKEDNYQEVYDGFDPNSDASYIFFNYLANVHLEQSDKMARLVQDQFQDRVGRINRGVKQAGFMVLWKASKPSILIETGFISNPEEEKFLKSEQGQDYLASAIFRSIRDYNAAME